MIVWMKLHLQLSQIWFHLNHDRLMLELIDISLESYAKLPSDFESKMLHLVNTHIFLQYLLCVLGSKYCFKSDTMIQSNQIRINWVITIS